MDRVEFNRVGGPKIQGKIAFEEFNRRSLSTKPMKFDIKQRAKVEAAIKQFCAFKKLTLYAVNVRTNHVHLVIAAGQQVEKIMGSIKSYATRGLRENGLVEANAKVWSRHGSTKYLWTEEHIAEACDYVVNRQGEPLPSFE